MKMKKVLKRFGKGEGELSYWVNVMYVEDSKVILKENIECGKEVENQVCGYMRVFGMY